MESELQALFIRRLQEEMERDPDRKLSGNALADLTKKVGYPVGQRTIARVLTKKQNPTLKVVEAIANTLGIAPWYLLMEADAAELRIIRPPTAAAAKKSVHQFPTQHPRIFNGDKVDKGKKSSAARRK